MDKLYGHLSTLTNEQDQIKVTGALSRLFTMKEEALSPILTYLTLEKVIRNVKGCTRSTILCIFIINLGFIVEHIEINFNLKTKSRLRLYTFLDMVEDHIKNESEPTAS